MKTSAKMYAIKQFKNFFQKQLQENLSIHTQVQKLMTGQVVGAIHSLVNHDSYKHTKIIEFLRK